MQLYAGSRDVTATWVNYDSDLVDVTVKGADGKPATLHTTSKHPFWDDTTHTWVPAAKLHIGDALNTDKNTRVTVLAVHPTPGAANRWNLTVAQLHTYYVLAGATPILVHNTCGGHADLYHATNSAGAASIRTNGVDPSFSPRPMDFGNGFYTTRSNAQAADWAARRFSGDGVVLHFRVPTGQLDALSSRSFAADSPDLAGFVRSFRSGNGTEVPPCDMVEGVNAGQSRAVPAWGSSCVVR